MKTTVVLFICFLCIFGRSFPDSFDKSPRHTSYAGLLNTPHRSLPDISLSFPPVELDTLAGGQIDELDLEENIVDMDEETLKQEAAEGMEEVPIDATEQESGMEVFDESVVEEELEGADREGPGHTPWALVGILDTGYWILEWELHTTN